MTQHTRPHRCTPTPVRGTIVRIATASALTVGLLATAPVAHAAPTPNRTSSTGTAVALINTADPSRADKATLRKARALARAQKRQKKFVGRIMGAARSRSGARYVYGASGPWAFDCSGLTRWVYQRAGKHLPRTSGAQAGATRRIARRDARPGDLVFFHSRGRVYHVGIFAGGNQLLHASKPGVPVGRGRIWTNQVFFGRVR